MHTDLVFLVVLQKSLIKLLFVIEKVFMQSVKSKSLFVVYTTDLLCANYSFTLLRHFQTKINLNRIKLKSFNKNFI